MATKASFRPGAAFGYETARLPLGSVPFLAGTRQELAVNGGIPKDFFNVGFMAKVRFRLTIAGGTTNGVVAAEAPQNLVERFEVSGQHKVFGRMTRLLLQGGHVYQSGRVYEGWDFRRAISVPLSPAAGTYDCETVYWIPFVPPDIRPEEQLLYLLDAPFWTTLQLYVDWGQAASLIVGGDRAVTVGGYGGVGADPTMDLWRIVAKLKGSRFNLNPVPVRQYYEEVALEANISANTIAEFDTGNFMRSFMLVTGLRATGASAARVGTNFLTLSDSIITRFTLTRDRTDQRDIDWIMNQQMEGMTKKLRSLAWPAGYNLIEFVEHGTLGTVYDTRGINLQNLKLTMTGDVAGAVDQRLHVIYNELTGVPVFST